MQPTEFYHGTSLEAIMAIQESGFRVDLSGSNAGAALGPGVYVTTTLLKALNYAEGATSKPNPASGGVLVLEVALGRCYRVRSSSQEERTSWAAHGYDSAWAAEGVIGIREENCVRDPARIRITNVVLGNTRAAQDSGYEVCNGRLRNVAAEKEAQRERDASRLIELGAERQRAIELLERYGSLQAAANALCAAADASIPSEVRKCVEQLRSGGGWQKEEAAKELRILARDNADNQVAIARAGGIAPLVALARGGADGQKEGAAGALANLALNADNQVAIARAGGIAPLVALARGGSDGQKQWGARALYNLACDNDDNQVAIARAGGIAPLVALARGGADGQKEGAAGALANLALNADNQVAIARAGGIAPLVALARGGTDGQKEEAAGALWNLAVNDDNKVAIARTGGIAPLVALARDGTDGQKRRAAGALMCLRASRAPRCRW